MGIRAYWGTLSMLIRDPRRFFAEEEAAGNGRLSPAAFLAVSSALSALAGICLGGQSGRLVMAAVLFVNAFGMTLLAAALAYTVMVPLAGPRMAFRRLFGIYAHSAGVTLLVSWNPVLLIFTEPWKWWLVWTGMRARGGLSRLQAAVVLVLSLGLILLLFWTLVPLTAPRGP
jgi:hypothetical protein